MANSLLSKWFGGPPAPVPGLAPALAELKALAEKKPSLASLCAMFQEILPELFAAPIQEILPVIDPTQAREKLAQGVPLLRGEKVMVEPRFFKRRWLAIGKALAQQNPNARAVAKAFTTLNPNELLAEVLAGRPEAVLSRAEALHLDAPLTGTILRLAAFPVLAGFATALEGLGQSTLWDRGFCPTCGSWPLLGELRGLDQLRQLRCGLCTADWTFPRLRCPFCDNRDHRQLGFLHVEGEESRYRVATCEHCRGYVKTTFTLAALNAPQLLVTDLAALDLDLVAADRGYFVA